MENVIRLQPKSDTTHYFISLLEKLHHLEERLDHLHIPRHIGNLKLNVGNTIKIISFDEILRIEADGNYTKVILDSGQSILVSKTLKAIFSQLPKEGFIRSHQSHVVRTSSISEACFGSESYLRLKEGSSIPIAMSKKKYLKSVISSF
ncbi:MAG: LytTR family transcriptional regulator [Saprospiraceae bacterium]|nr:LytTR family transcriptional regulator [Saprospiraceae bacterium]